MPSSDDKSYIDELKKSLYSRTTPEVQSRRKVRFSDENSEIKTEWEHPEEEAKEIVELNTNYKNHSMSFFTKLFIASAIFCFIAVGAGAYLFWNGANFISADNIEVSIKGPVSIAGGEPITLDITAINKNNIGLESVDMLVDFPTGSTDPFDSSKPLKSYHKVIGKIPAGGVVNDSVRVIIFGEENLQKQITVTLTYNVSGSTSVFTKVRTYDVLINSSPINVKVSSFKEITSGQEFDMKVELNSNSKEILRNVMVKATYPFGYSFISSTIAAQGDKSSWSLGDIPSGGKRSFSIHGSLTGEDKDLRVFHFNIGTKNPQNTNEIGTQFMALEQDITIQKPFITLNVEIDNDQGIKDHIGQFGQTSNVVIKWFNNLPTIVSNMKITAKLSGSAYDKTTVVPDMGHFDSGTDTILWSQQTNPELASIGPGDSGSVAFTVIPKNQSGSNVQNPIISISTTVSGNRTQETNVPLSITSKLNRNILISSNIGLSGRVVRTVGSFTNSGPIPPKVDTPTTYTVIWSVSNTSNAVSDAVVKATLPPYVKWLNLTNPASEDISYDQNSGQVTWNVGSIKANTSGLSLRREVMFGISLIPSVTQTGQSPVLVNQTSLEATDNFTNKALRSNQDPLTTRFSTDPTYQSGNEIVSP